VSIVLVTFENWQFSKSSTIAKTLKFYQNVRQALRIVVANVGIIFEKCVVTGDFLIVFSSLGLGMKGKILASIRLSH
jgi:hypothetical protein